MTAIEAALRELIRLYDWRNELGRIERDFNHDKKKMTTWLNQYGREKHAAWKVAREALQNAPIYSPDQQRAADYIVEATGGNLGGGDDPVGFLIASHATIAADLKKERAPRIFYAQCKAHQGIPFEMTTTAIVHSSIAVCPICNPPK